MHYFSGTIKAKATVVFPTVQLERARARCSININHGQRLPFISLGRQQRCAKILLSNFAEPEVPASKHTAYVKHMCDGTRWRERKKKGVEKPKMFAWIASRTNEFDVIWFNNSSSMLNICCIFLVSVQRWTLNKHGRNPKRLWSGTQSSHVQLCLQECFRWLRMVFFSHCCAEHPISV